MPCRQAGRQAPCEPMAATAVMGVAPAVCNSSRVSKRRPRCRIGLWALVATALSLATCKASRQASAPGRAGSDAGLPLAGNRAGRAWGVGGGGAWATTAAVAGQLRGGAQAGGKGRSSISGSRRQQEDKHAQRETLYDAYNMLHTLAQVSAKRVPVPAPRWLAKSKCRRYYVKKQAINAKRTSKNASSLDGVVVISSIQQQQYL